MTFEICPIIFRRRQSLNFKHILQKSAIMKWHILFKFERDSDKADSDVSDDFKTV